VLGNLKIKTFLLQKASKLGRLIGHYTSATHGYSPFPIFFLIDYPIERKNASLSKMRNEQSTQKIEKPEHIHQNADKHFAATGLSHLIGCICQFLSDKWYF